MPDDCEYDDLIMLGPDWLDSHTDYGDWEVSDSDGMELSGIEVKEADPEDSPGLWLRWGRDGLEPYDPEKEDKGMVTES